MSILPKTAEQTSDYLPHSGNMCLIDEVLSINELSIAARTLSHQNKYHPLKFADRLPAVSGIEYAAQTIALHLALNQADQPDKQGFLAAVQSCVIHKDYLDSSTHPIHIECQQIYLDSQSGALYEFTLTATEEIILNGRLLIMFKSSEVV